MSRRARRSARRTSSRSGSCPGSTTGPTEGTIEFIEQKFAKRPEIVEANTKAFKAGWNYGETSEDFASSYEIAPAKVEPGTYRQVSGNTALTYGLVAASKLSGLPLFLGAYPITPASDVLEQLAQLKHFGVRTFQAEDEIAASGAALGAAFGGALGVTTSAGPGIVLKSETVGLAVTLELPLAHRRRPARRPVDRDADEARAGRPADGALRTELGVARSGRRRLDAVGLLRRGYRGGADRREVPHARLPALGRLPRERLRAVAHPGRRDAARHLDDVRDRAERRRPASSRTGATPRRSRGRGRFPGRPGLEHRIGGLEKEDETGNVSYDPENHDRMVRLRAAKVAGIAADIPELEVDDPDGADTLVLGWGSTYGAIGAAARRVRATGRKVATAHLHHLNPFPRNTGEVVRAYDKVLIPEMNLGQLRMLIRAAVPRRRGGLQQGARTPVPGGGARGRDHGAGGLVMAEGNGNLVQLTGKDFKSDQEVRWCPGCGDYAILNVIQGFMPELGLERERIVFVSGIGCAARFPYYMQTYGMHSIHGRAPAIATGLAVTRPDLSVWVVTGDGDALSIGGNHLIHALRRNVNLKILLFNNQIYGLTKGQYSPTSELGKVTKSTPMGSLDYPFNPLSVAIGAEASFVARAIDTDKKGLTEVLGAAARHRGSAFVEILQNCNIYNDGAFDFVREDKGNRIYLEDGERIRFGTEGEKGVQQYPDGSLRVVDVAEAGENSLLVHDASHAQASLAFALSRITFETDGAVPLGVFRRVERPVYDDLMSEQLDDGARAARRGRARGAPPLGRHLDGRVEPTLFVAPAFRSGQGRSPYDDSSRKRTIRSAISSPFSSCRKWPAPATVSAGPAPGMREAMRSAATVEKIGSESEKRTSAGLLPASRARHEPLVIFAALGWSSSVGTSSGNASTPAFDSGVGKGAL